MQSELAVRPSQYLRYSFARESKVFEELLGTSNGQKPQPSRKFRG